MTADSKIQFDIIQPHPIEGVIVLCLGLGLATYSYWLPSSMEPYFGRSNFVFWTTLIGFVLIGAGLWRAGWRHRIHLDANRRKVTTTHGFFGIGKRRSVDFSKIRDVRVRRVREEATSSHSGGGSRLVEHYPISLEGRVVSVYAGWSGYYEESIERAKRIAKLLDVPLRDVTPKIRDQ